MPPLAVRRTSVGIGFGLSLLLMLFAPPLPAGIGEIGEMRLNTDPMPTPPRIGENGEIQSVKEPMPPPEEFIKSLTYWEVSEMRSDT